MRTVVTAQLSVPTGGVKFTTAAQVPAAAFTLMLEGHAMTGEILSVTVTLKEQVAVVPEPVVAVYVTVVLPTGKASPGA